MLPGWARLRHEVDLRDWWNAQPAAGIALDWLNVPIYWVSSQCTAWHAARVDLLRAATPAPALLVVARATAGAVIVYGLVPLAAPPAPLLGGALVQRRWLYEHEMAGAIAEEVPPLAHITLEHTWLRRPHVLADVVFDPTAERPLIARAIDTLREFARGRVPPETWAPDEATQLEAAKMRFYVRESLLRAPATLEIHRVAIRTGADALGAWTAATVRRHVTSEKRALALITTERLPFDIERLSPAPLAATCACGGVPLPQHADAPGLAATYSACGDARASRLIGGCVCALQATGRWIMLTAPSSLAYAYVAALPTSFFVVRNRDAPALRLSELLAALYIHGWAPPGGGLTKVCEPLGDDLQLWAVPELVWPSGRALGEFLAAAQLDSRWDYTQDGTLPASPFVPHPHIQWMPPRENRRNVAGKAVGTMHTACRLRPRRGGAPIAWPALADWIGARVAADVQRMVGHSLLDKPVAAAIMREIGTSLLAQLHAIAAYSCARPVDMSTAEVFRGRDYCRLEEWICARRERLKACFQELMGAEPVRNDGVTKLRAGGHLTLTVDGPFMLCWRDFKLTRGGGYGRGLGSLIMYQMEGTTAAGALHFLDQWAAMRATQELMSTEVETPAVAAAPVADPEVAAETLVTARATVARHLSKMTSVLPTTVAGRYLREMRGLADAPASLIEHNRALGTRERATIKIGTDDERLRTATCATLGFVSAGQTGIQLIYLDPATCRKITYDVAKKTHGRLALGNGRFDAVPIVAAPDHHVPRVFLAEGPETALSVALAFPGEPVYAALGATFMRGFGGVSADEVVICRENDTDAKGHIAIEMRRARAVLATRFARVREVWPPAGYGDFNDIHQRSPGAAGSAVIRVAIDGAT